MIARFSKRREPKPESARAETARAETRWTRRKDARPAELLAAALDLFVERGYAGTRLDDVARRAGVSKGTLYLYYSSKEQLFKAVIREGLVPVYEHGERMVDAHTGSAEDLIRNLLRVWWDTIGATNLGGIPKLMIAESGNFPEVTRFYFDEVVSRGRKLVARALRLGIDAGEFRDLPIDQVVRLMLAPVMLMAIWRYSFEFCDTTHLDPDSYLSLHVDVLLNGLRQKIALGTMP
ncbi:MAG: TetR/AcrR family transcriptional regulator [Betaproteobacteria bacterium]